MRPIKMSLAAGLALAALATPVRAETVEEVIARHIEARGGEAAWAAIESMAISGNFQAFSLVEPFTLHRKRDASYHIDHLQNKKRVVIGYDGEKAWWDNGWSSAGPEEISGPDLAVVLRDADFATPFFDYEQRGYEVKLLGDSDLEGMQTIGIELTRTDGSTETWYLDPDTYLEVGRDSPGSDFGRAMTQRSFFDDFRKVGKVVIPHLTETQWYTRDRIMMIDSISTNVEVDDAMFRLPAPTGMGPFLALAGSWSVAVQRRNQPEAEWQDSERTATIEAMMQGGLLQEQFKTGQGNDVIRTLSYDRFKECYRITQINGRDKQMDIHEGEMNGDGTLSVSNIETDTPSEGFGMTFHSRISIFDVTEDGFKMEQEVTIDAGKNWFTAVKSTYTRSGEGG